MRMHEAMNALTTGQAVDVSKFAPTSAQTAGKAAGVVPGSMAERQVSLG